MFVLKLSSIQNHIIIIFSTKYLNSIMHFMLLLLLYIKDSLNILSIFQSQYKDAKGISNKYTSKSLH